MIIDGLTIVVALVLAFAGLVLFVAPPRYRCQVCAATFTDFPALVDHEAAHFPRRCKCGPGTTHHPSCPTTDKVVPRRAVA